MTTRDKLEALAANLWWSWNPEVLDLFRRLNPDAFRSAGNNPQAALEAADPSLIENPRYAQDVDEAHDAFRHYLHRRPSDDENAPHVAYFCMEYGLHESLPLYSGGLGILAGDHAKAASDHGLPFTAVGLLLRDGYFQQSFDENGWQQAAHVPFNPADHPLTLVTDDEGQTLTVTVSFSEQHLALRAWRLDVGRTTLYLLDSDFDANPSRLRPLTRKLYQGDDAERLQQEMILGIGGRRLLHAIGVTPDLYHMNEGHCAFLTLELLHEERAAGAPPSEAADAVREQCVFTTHTPVLAGHDYFAPDLFEAQMGSFCDEAGLSASDLLGYGRVDPSDDEEPFCMTVLGLRLSGKANGVSKLNGTVARHQWRALYPDRPTAEVPISHITNGVHLPTWTAPHARAVISERLGDWRTRRADPAFWQQIDQLSDAQLWQYRNTLRGILLDFVRRRVEQQSLKQDAHLDPEALTIGFARRFATYKRALLLFHDEERAVRLFSQTDRPLQIIYAGKAHPADDAGKRLIQRIYELSHHPALQGQLIFLENYDMEVGRMLVSGCDVWLNNPRRPMEACGTSGQKIALHGGLNLSILDGWWPEGYNGQNGWATGDASGPPEEKHATDMAQDQADAAALYQMLEDRVIPTFYDRDAQGIPHDWVARMRNAIKTLPARFSADRMVNDYVEQMHRLSALEAVDR